MRLVVKVARRYLVLRVSNHWRFHLLSYTRSPEMLASRRLKSVAVGPSSLRLRHSSHSPIASKAEGGGAWEKVAS